jgi:hypothetical protein
MLTKFLRAAFTRGGGAAASVSYRANYSSTTDASTYTFTASDIGTETNRSAIVIAVHTTSNGPSSVTVGGTGATQINTTGATLITSLWRVSGVSGTTADIVVNIGGGNATRCLIGVYALYNLRSSTPVDNSTTSTLSGTSLTRTISTVVDGVIIGAASANASGRTYTWTGATENYDTVIETASSFSGASNTTTSNTTTTVSFTIAGGSAGITYGVASWR